jgi:hypothetical protein
MREIRIEQEHEEQVISQVITSNNNKHAGHTIYPEVRQPHKGVPTSSLLRWPLRSESLSPPCLPQATTKVSPRFPLRIQGWYKHFGVPSQVEQHRQPWRTPSRLGFQEPKSNKHKPSQLEREPSAQDVNRSFPLSNLFSLLKSCKGLDLGAKRKKERVSQCWGAVCLKVGRSKWRR